MSDSTPTTTTTTPNGAYGSVSHQGASGGGGDIVKTYGLGNWDFLPSGVVLSGDSPDKVIQNIKNHFGKGANDIFAKLAFAISGNRNDFGNNISGAIDSIRGALTHTKGNYRLDGFLQQGGWDYKKGKPYGVEAPPAGGSGNGASNVVQNVYYGGGSTPSGIDQMTATQQLSAYDTINAKLSDWGLADLAPWAWSQISEQGNFKNAALVLQELRQQPEYKARFPGLVERKDKNLPHMNENQYMDFELAAEQMARNYGLPEGFMGKEEISKLVASDVSASELDQRLKNGYQVAMHSSQQVRDLLQKYYGVDTGHLAAYYLDPSKTYDILNKQLQGAKIGTAAIKSGFGGIGRKTANELASQMSDSGMGMDYFRQGFKQIAPLKPMEEEQIGQRGQATVTKQQLLGEAFSGLTQATGTTAAGNKAAVQLAEQARLAGLQTGGGYAAGNQGVSGVGRAGTSGRG